MKLILPRNTFHDGFGITRKSYNTEEVNKQMREFVTKKIGIELQQDESINP